MATVDSRSAHLAQQQGSVQGMHIAPVNIRAATAPDQIIAPAQMTAYQHRVYENVQSVMDVFARRFQRHGWDDRGSQIDVIVHETDHGQPLNNAYWDSSRAVVALGDGDGVLFAPLGEAVDVIAHEIGHAIISSEVHLSGLEGGALHESFADVLATACDADWLIGEDVFTPKIVGDALRDMAAPRYTHLDQVRSSINVHELSGIPSLAAVRSAQHIGMQQMQDLWHQALLELPDHAGLLDAAKATQLVADRVYGSGSWQQAAVRQAWHSVGITEFA